MSNSLALSHGAHKSDKFRETLSLQSTMVLVLVDKKNPFKLELNQVIPVSLKRSTAVLV